MVPKTKLEHTLRFVRELCGRASTGLRATALLNEAAWEFGNVIILDASPWGGGAFLSERGIPQAYIHTAWGDLDTAALNFRIGDHRCQAVVETYIVLIAVRAWSHRWSTAPTNIRGRSDSMAAIGAVERGASSRSVAVNRILQELALEVALSPTGLSISLRHIRGEVNEWADALSRLTQPGSGARVPAPLLACEHTQLEDRGPSWWRMAQDPEKVLEGMGEGDVV